MCQHVFIWMDTCGKKKNTMPQCIHLERAVPELPLVDVAWRKQRRRGVWVWLASCSLIVCCGTRTDSWGGGLNVQPGQSEGLPWTHTHDSEVSRGLWSYLWCGDCEWIHPLAVKRETKTLSRVWGAVEFDRRGGLPPYRVRSAVRAGVIETHTHTPVCVGRLL